MKVTSVTKSRLFKYQIMSGWREDDGARLQQHAPARGARGACSLLPEYCARQPELGHFRDKSKTKQDPSDQ